MAAAPVDPYTARQLAIWRKLPIKYKAELEAYEKSLVKAPDAPAPGKN